MEQEYLTELAQILATRFAGEELRTLCFSLGIDYDDLPSLGKAGKARELILYLERRGQISRLVETGKQHRPDISWPAPSVTTPRPTLFPTLRPLYQQRMIWAGVAVLSLLAATAVIILALRTSKDNSGEALGEVPTARPDEVMILIAEFKAEAGIESYDVSQRIHNKLSDDLRQLGEKEVTVRQIREVIESSEEAVALGQRYGATTVIWGFYDDIGISPNVEAVGLDEDNLLSVGLERFNLDPSEVVNFRLYIAKDLPEEVSFLTAVSLLQTSLVQEDVGRMLSYIDLATRNLPSEPQFRGGGEMVFFAKALMAALRGDVEQALENLDQAIVINPDQLVFYIVRGVAYVGLGEASRALADFEHAIALEPRDQVTNLVHAYKGVAHWQAGDCESALRTFDHLVELNPADLVPYYGQGWIGFETGDLTLALAAWGHVEEHDPENEFVPIARGLVYEKRGQANRAKADSRWPWVYFLRAQAVVELGRTDEAQADLEQALQLSPVDELRQQIEALQEGVIGLTP